MVNSDDIFGQINVNRLIYRTSTLRYSNYLLYLYTSRINICTAYARAWTVAVNDCMPFNTKCDGQCSGKLFAWLTFSRLWNSLCGMAELPES